MTDSVPSATIHRRLAAESAVVVDVNGTHQHFLAACLRGRASLVQTLLTNGGVNVQFTNLMGETALHKLLEFHQTLPPAAQAETAIYHHDDRPHRGEITTEILRLLLQAGFDPSTVDYPIHTLCRDTYGEHDRQTLWLLFRSNCRRLESRDAYGHTPLLTACLADNEKVVRLLLHHGANIDARDYNGKNALTLACEYGLSNVLLALIECGANVNATRLDNGQPILHHVITQSNQTNMISLVPFLLEHGAHVDALDKEGWTALHYACRENNHASAVQTLIKHGANARQTTPTGHSPFFLACQCGALDIMFLLLAECHVITELRW